MGVEGGGHRQRLFTKNLCNALTIRPIGVLITEVVTFSKFNQIGFNIEMIENKNVVGGEFVCNWIIK